MTSASVRSARTGLLVVFGLFIVLGLPEGVLGTAWPSMRTSFGQPVSSLAWLIGFYTIGYLLSTLGSGHLPGHLDVSAILQGGVAFTATGLALYAVSPVWWVALVAAFTTGVGAGTVDATANAYCAVAGGARVMNLLHAFFGIGATIGPIGVAVLLDLDRSWRFAYVGVLVLEVMLFWVLTRNRSEFALPTDPEVQAVTSRPPMPRSLLAAMLAVFVFYVGAEVSYGQWSFSLLTEERGVGEKAAGWAVAGYWGSLTVGRLALGWLGGRVEPEQVLRMSAAGTLLGAVVFWLDPAPGLDVLALLWIGFAMAGVFPAMVLLTPRWIGATNTARAVGYQLAASSASVIVVSAGIGAAVRAYGLEAMPVILGVVVLGLVLALYSAGRVAANLLSDDRR